MTLADTQIRRYARSRTLRTPLPPLHNSWLFSLLTCYHRFQVICVSVLMLPSRFCWFVRLLVCWFVRWLGPTRTLLFASRRKFGERVGFSGLLDDVGVGRYRRRTTNNEQLLTASGCSANIQSWMCWLEGVGWVRATCYVLRRCRYGWLQLTNVALVTTLDTLDTLDTLIL